MQNWIIGKKKTGKTEFLKKEAIRQIYKGKPIAYFAAPDDSDILNYIPKHRVQNTILLDFADYEFPVAFNPLDMGPDAFAETVKSLYRIDIAAPNITTYLPASIEALTDKTFTNVTRFARDQDYRHTVLSTIDNTDLKRLFEYYDGLKPNEQDSRIESSLNKLYGFLTDNRMRNVIGQETGFVRDGLKDKFIIVLLGRGEKMSLMGSLLLAYLDYSNFPGTYFIDNGHRFAPRTVMNLIENDAKLYFVNHYLAQLDDALRECLIGMVPTLYAFRLGVSDAERLREEFDINDGIAGYTGLTLLPNYTAHIASEGQVVPSCAIEPTHRERKPYAPTIQAESRRHYASPRAAVEARLNGS